MTADQPAAHRAEVGARVTALRERRGLSLSALARAAGIGKGSLSELESGRRNPTLDTLYAVAGPLNVALTALVGEESGTGISGSETGGSDPALMARLLHVEHHPDGSTTEVFWLRIGPGKRESPAHGAGVREHLRVVRGTVRAGPLRGEESANAGETIEFTADVAHSYASDDGAVAVLTIDSPSTAHTSAPTADAVGAEESVR